MYSFAPSYRLITHDRSRASSNFCAVEKSVHIGNLLKKKIKELRIRPTDLIAEMKIAKQSFYNQLARPTIDTGMLQRFSEKIGYNFFLNFIEPQELRRLIDETPFVDPVEFNKLRAENKKLRAENEKWKTDFIRLYEKYTKKLESNEELEPEKKAELRNVKIIGNS